ncbi:MAG TPA: SDR family oxidoreductase [Rubricoccaceae bacterium]|jgi:NAD(P)-dependent dehydrogenase (short-subunit alcohol dehydrogenase family)
MRASTLLAGAWAVARAVRAPRAVSFENRTVVLSGGSRGLGLLVARRLVGEGAQVALLARTATDLDAAAAELGENALPVVCDVRDRAAVEAAVQTVVDHFGPPSVLLHDAGVISVGPEAHMTEADYAESLDIHFWGAFHLTEAVRPHLPRDGSARVGYVSSIGGRVAIPHLGPYSVGKHALVGYADAMRAELATDGIRVTTITPGLMRTGSHPNAQVKGQHEKEYAWFAIGDAAPGLSMDGDRAAGKIVDALRHGDAALTLTVAAKLAAAVDGVAPGVVGTAMKAVSALLPGPAGPDGDLRKTGWESQSAAAPSVLTALADRETEPNNELRGHAPPGP